MKDHYILRGKHGTYVMSNWCYDLDEARKWRDETRTRDRDTTIQIIKVREIEEVVE